MSQGLLDLESIESITPPTAKSPIIQDLILMKHDKCSSPEDENLQTLMGSPISDKDDELENEIPEIMLSSEHLDVTPSSCVSENAGCKLPDSVDSDPQTICAISNSNVENPGAVVNFYTYHIIIYYVSNCIYIVVLVCIINDIHSDKSWSLNSIYLATLTTNFL